MNYEQFASDLPLSNAIELTSPEQSEELLQSMGIEQPMRQIGAGPFRYRFATQSHSEADFFADRFRTAVSLHLEAPEGMVGLLFPRTASGRFMASGDKVGDRSMIVVPERSGTDITGPDRIGSEAIVIPRHRFRELIEALIPTSMAIRAESMMIIAGDITQLHALRRCVRKLAVGSAKDTGRENIANLVAATIEWLARYSPGYKPERILGHAARARVAMTARDYIEDHYSDTVRLEDLCRVTRTSARTLQRCFREYFDLTSTDYLNSVRLDQARRELLATNPSMTSVTTVAMRHGNTHLGRFSVNYRARFGESPKETLADQRS